MRIALVAPLAEAVPPKLYGGTERVVSWLAEELVRQGHKVTLFASGGSRDSGKPCRLRAAKPETCGNSRSPWQYVRHVAGGAPARR